MPRNLSHSEQQPALDDLSTDLSAPSLEGSPWSVRPKELLEAGDYVRITGFDVGWPHVERAVTGRGAGPAATKCH